MSKQFKESNKDEIDLNKLFRIILRNIYIVLSSSIFFFLISVFYALNSKRIWEGHLQIVLPSQKSESGINLTNRLSGIAGFNNPFGGLINNSQLKTEVEILRSPSVLLPVYKTVLKSRNIPLEESNNFLTFNEWRKGDLRIKLETDTSVLNIRFRDTNKELILPVLRQITSQYKKYSSRDKIESSSRRITFLDKQIDTYKQNADKAFEEADNFALKHNLSIDIQSQNLSSNNQSFAKLTTNQEISRMKAMDEMTRLMEFSKQLEEVNDNPDITLFLAAEIKKIQPDPEKDILPVVNKILAVRDSIALMKTNYTEEDPSLKELNSLQKSYQEELRIQINALIKARKRSAESVIQSSYRKPEITAKYKQLLREAFKTEAFLDQFQTEKKNVLLDANFKSKSWDLITEPTLNPNPVGPFRKRIAGFGLISGILIGCTIAIIYDKKRGIIYEIDEVQSFIGANLIKTYSNDKKEELEEIISLLVNNVSSLKNEKIISLLKIGDIESNTSKEIKLCFEKNALIKKVYISDNFKDCEKFINQIILISLGKIKRSELIEVKEKLNIQSEPILGWINISDD